MNGNCHGSDSELASATASSARQQAEDNGKVLKKHEVILTTMGEQIDRLINIVEGIVKLHADD